MKIVYKKYFLKQLKKLSLDIQIKTKEKIKLFQNNPFDIVLNNHRLNWNLSDYRSINITWDYRAIFIELSWWKYEFIEFVNIWTHSSLY